MMNGDRKLVFVTDRSEACRSNDSGDDSDGAEKARRSFCESRSGDRLRRGDRLFFRLRLRRRTS